MNEYLRRIDERDYLTEREHREFLKKLERDLGRLECIESVLDNIANRLKLEVKNIFTLETEIFNRLEVLDAIKSKAQNNRFYKGCLLRMFVDIKRENDGAFSKKVKVKYGEYELIKNWLEGVK